MNATLHIRRRLELVWGVFDWFELDWGVDLDLSGKAKPSKTQTLLKTSLNLRHFVNTHVKGKLQASCGHLTVHVANPQMHLHWALRVYMRMLGTMNAGYMYV